MIAGLVSICLTTSFCFSSVSVTTPVQNDRADTATINGQTREALSLVRKNPDLALMLGYKALSLSGAHDYHRGMADASLAIGTGYLSKFMLDSADVYTHRALELYKDLDDNFGMARSCYALAYLCSFRGELDGSERYALTSLDLFSKDNHLAGMTNSLNVLSYLANTSQHFDKAIEYAGKAVETAKMTGDTLLLADVINSLGNNYKDAALFSQAIDTYFEALRLWELKNDPAGLSLAYGNIGLIYFYQKDYSKAMEYTKKKLPVSVAMNDLWEIAKTNNNIAQIYNATHKFDSSQIFLRRSLHTYRLMSYTPGIIDASKNIASGMLVLGQTDSAFCYISQAVEMARATNDPRLEEYYVTLAGVYQAMGRLNSAIEHALKAFKMAEEKHVPLVRADASFLLSELYNKTGRDDLAYRYLTDYQQVKDSISNVEFLRQISRLELQYDFDKKQRAAEYVQASERLERDNKIRQQKIFLRGLAVLLVLVALISFLILRHNQLQSRYSRIDLEQRLLRAQMNPHFIFNSLCAVQDFILADKPRMANLFLTKIARLMRNILENSREEFIPLEREIETLRLYMDVQQLRFENGFDYEIKVDEAIDTENFAVPPMLAQPCVENSIEHGLLPAKEKGQIGVTYTLKDDLIMLEVTDNGIGRQQAAGIPQRGIKKQSVSSHLNASRLQHFRKTLKKKKISYELIDLYEGERNSGTKVMMMLPYRKIYA